MSKPRRRASSALQGDLTQDSRGLRPCGAFGDVMIRPLELGWHARRADVTTGIDFYLPTGRYEPGGDDNVGKGMVTFESYAGTTLFFDEKRSTSLATTAFWEINGKKKHTNAKVGQILTLEGGIGSRSWAVA
jgi:hypothetical protein